MIRFTFGLVASLFAVSVFAQTTSLKDFNDRFHLQRNAENTVVAIKLKKATTFFTVMPFIRQLKQDLLGQQEALLALSETEIDELLISLGANPYALSVEEGSEEARHIKESILNIRNIDINDTFAQLNDKGFWQEFQIKLNEALQFLDPSVLANLEDPRFFYKKNVSHKVVVWALEQAQKKFTNIPVLGIASFIIVRVHEMMMEQRHYAHNILLHYFENVKESELGMTKEEVNKAVSSIHEYRIEATNIFESNRAASDWNSYGMNRFFAMIRSGNMTINDWKSPFSARAFKDVKKINFAFAEVTENNVKKIYHLHNKAHMFSSKPALAFDFSKPNRLKQTRALLNVGGVALGFLKLPGWIKGNVDSFLKSLYVSQVRTEGALVGYFETSGNTSMKKHIFSQRSNLYIKE